jgi:acetyl esterase/lipase
VLALRASSPARPGPFYAVPSPLPRGPAGTIIRKQLIPNFYPGAKAYRVLYKSTGLNGRPAAVSGLIVVPTGPPPRRGRKVIAFTHATVGLASSCAPSVQQGGAVQVIEGLGQFIAAGYVVAATDYLGLGTPGPPPYLLGPVEAMGALDSVRAAHRLRQAHAGVEFAVWGHSAGGQASLFTAELAPSYAPELRLAGVAAGAPMPDLVSLFKVNVATTAGRVLIALALYSWEHVYDDPGIEQIVAPAARGAIAAIASQCLYGSQILGGAAGADAVSLTLTHGPPWKRPPWNAILAQNTPGTLPIAAPILLTQGGADKIVPAPVTERFAKQLCARGERVDLRLYPSAEHLEAGVLVAPDVASWIAERFAGKPAPSSCR